MQGSTASVAGVPGLVRTLYESGLARSAEADELMRQAMGTASVPRSRELRTRAGAGYRRAEAAFEEVVSASPRLYQAWNQLGYARRRAGDHPRALQAYAMALRLQPGYGPAIEYRAEAHLALGHLEDVKAAYLELFGSEPALAAELSRAIAAWLRRPTGKPAAEDVAAFRSWFQERQQLAKQAGGDGGSWVGQPGAQAGTSPSAERVPEH
jgi:tetratricopeptide (TPR) repeat protein